MAKLLKLRRGTTTQHSSFTGAEGEVTVDTDKETLVVHDGSTAGGHPVAAEDMANVSSASIAGRLGTNSIATSKIAAGALPSDVTVASANIVDGTIVAGDIGTDQINNTHIADNAIQRPMIADNAVNGAKIADSSINSNKILNDSIVNADINSSAAIAGTKISPDFGSQDVSIQSDSHKFLGGASEEMQVFHDGTNTVIKDTRDSGKVRIQADNFDVIDKDASTTIITADVNGINIPGNITVTGTVDGIDVAGQNTLMRSVVASSGNLNNGVTATTQSASDNSTKVATTAYTDTAISNLVDSSPSALNTLNELAAALGDDANFSTTVTNSIATKLPLAGGTVSGGIDFSTTSQNDIINFTGSSTSDQRGIAFNSRTALSADHNDGYLRLNDASEFTNGVYSTGQFETTGVIKAGQGVNVGSTNVINSSGQVVAARITGALPAIDGSALTGIVSFVSGMIILWSGAANNLPSGWVLCDGNNSTPDLRDRFVIGAGNSYSVGATGGSTTDSVNISVSGTTGTNNGSNIRVGFGNQNWHPYAAPQNHTHTFSGSGTDTVSTMSPYYALCYIMKT